MAVVYSTAHGLGFSRAAISTAQSQNLRDAYGHASGTWGPASPPAVYLKAAITAGTTTDAAWMGPAADSSLSDEFIQFVRSSGRSVVETLAPAMKTVQFSTRVLLESDETIVASWVGEGAAKGLTYGTFATVELSPYKLQATVVVTKEFLRMSAGADVAVRSILASALSKAQDQAFLSADAATPTRPAGIADGAAAISSTGDPATDLAALIESFSGDLSTSYLIMHPSAAAAIGLHNPVQDVGAKGGSVAGIPVLTSKHVLADSSGSSILLVDAAQILFAGAPIQVSTALHASVEMSDVADRQCCHGQQHVDGVAIPGKRGRASCRALHFVAALPGLGGGADRRCCLRRGHVTWTTGGPKPACRRVSGTSPRRSWKRPPRQ